MGLKAVIEADVAKAMKERQQAKVGTLRMVLSAVKNREIDTRKPLTDAEIMTLLNSMIKQRQEAAVLYQQGNRPELVEKEEAEIALIRSYLPAPLEGAELEALVNAAIAESNATQVKDMGKVMKVLMPKLQGRADGKVVNQLVQQKLSS